MNTKIILASTSPRRIELMSQAGIDAEVLAPNIEETPKRGEKPRDLVKRLAREKAGSVAMLAPDSAEDLVIIAADTIVVAPGGKRILGKPSSGRDAERMLRVLSGKTHEVLTAYCILALDLSGNTTECVRVVSSKVSIRPLTPAMIRDYVAGGEPMDKAGSYAAQGFGMNWISSIRGSYTNVVGLPMCELLSDLEEWFGVSGKPPRK